MEVHAVLLGCTHKDVTGLYYAGCTTQLTARPGTTCKIQPCEPSSCTLVIPYTISDLFKFTLA